MADLIGLHHVAFAEDAGSSTHTLLAAALGLEVAREEEGEGFLERMIPVDDSYLQILEPTGSGIVQRFVDRRGPSLHHIAFEVDDIGAILKTLRERGVPLVDDEPRPGGMGTMIAFVHPSAFGGLLVELVQGATPKSENE